MTDGLVRLSWAVYSDYRIERSDTKGGPDDWIVGVGAERKYQATLSEHGIFLDLINSARRPEEVGVLEFVRKWGLLCRKRWLEPLDYFLSKRNAFLDLASGKVDDNDIDPKLNVIVERKRGRPQIFFQAPNPLEFCVLEFYHAQGRGIDLKACGACGEFLPLHKQGRPKRYCDDACKMMAYRTKHRDAINRKRRQNRATSESKGRRYARARSGA